MSNEISWPTNPFYIMSKLGRSNRVLTARSDGTLILSPLTGTIDQVWTATPGLAGGAILRHVNTGKVLATQTTSVNLFGREMTFPAGAPRLEDLDTSKPAQLWRVEDLGDNWVGINCLLNWESKLNIDHSDFNRGVILYHWDGGADNEEWRLVQETGQLTVDSVTYDVSKAVADLGLPPAHCTAISVDNRAGNVPAGSTYQLQRSVTTQRSITNSQSDTTGQKYTETFSVKGGISKVVEVSASTSFEQSESKTISLTDQKTDSETNADTIATQINVPAGKVYTYHVVVHYGKVTVPYVATSTFRSSTPGVAPVTVTTHGMFTGVNSTGCDIIVADVTPVQADTPVQAGSSSRAAPGHNVVSVIPVA